jgi:hypothetical protein
MDTDRGRANRGGEGSGLTDGAEVEEEGKFSSAGQTGSGLAQLFEEGVGAGLQGGQPGHRGVL